MKNAEKERAVLQACPLFAGIGAQEGERLLGCLKAERAFYEKGAVIFRLGQTVSACVVVLSGLVRAETVNAQGDHTLTALHGPGALVGDVLMATPGGTCPVYVLAAEPTAVLLLPFHRIMDGCPESCPAHTRLRENLVAEIAQKYWALRRRLTYLSTASLRSRIAMYLLDRSGGTAAFSVNLRREDMADYLCVNRSALSRELARMKQEGLLDYYRDTFRILDAPALSRWAQE